MPDNWERAVSEGGEWTLWLGRIPDLQRSPDRRPSAAARGYDKTHRDWREKVLKKNPICVLCNSRVSKRADHYPRGVDELRAAGVDP